MTRPQIIRADTIDLQSHDSPSAKDHTRQPTHPAPLGDGPPAPHQAVALRHAEQDVEFPTRSPRMSQDLSNKELQLLHEDSDSFDSTNAAESDIDTHTLQRNGGSHGAIGEEGDIGDGEGDEGSEDDLMDKISSSPSIEDGGYLSPLSWPRRGDLLHPNTKTGDAAPTPPEHVNFSSPPFLSPPPQFSVLCLQKVLDQDPSEDHHHEGEYVKDQTISAFAEGESEIGYDNYWDRQPREISTDLTGGEADDMQAPYDDDFDLENFHHLLVPALDPLLDNSFEDTLLSAPSASPSPPILPHSAKNAALDEIDDDAEDISYSDDDRFVDSGWGGECLREIEDIDFDFVYALHTFVATVEGQANATKGDTMVLLDDTNSYWWLVRVVKDGSIGYLPAEHIETPTERLARLNKHRNIDLSQAMLGDSHEKSKNPLKKAMRRRNGKTVQFAAPTYVEPPDVDYSTEEEVDSDQEYLNQEDENKETQDGDQEEVRDSDDIKVDPSILGEKSNEAEPISDSQVSASRESVDMITPTETERTSDETLERSDDGTSGRSRKGTVRNTDSFFKDENLETRKINLTPSLLRDDSSGSTVKSNEGKELKTRGSLDSLEKPQPSPERSKEDKKRKEKKGMLGGLFKRRDKKNKLQEDENGDGKTGADEVLGESPQPKISLDSISQDTQSTKSTIQTQPQRQTSKLQKAPPVKLSGKPPTSQVELAFQNSATDKQQDVINCQPERVTPPIVAEEARVTAVALSPDGKPGSSSISVQRMKSPETPLEEHVQSRTHADLQCEALSPADNVMSSSTSDLKPATLKTVKQRVPLDDFDSPPEVEKATNPLLEYKERHLPDVTSAGTRERLSESPVEVVPPDQSRSQALPPLVIDTSSQEEPSISPVSPASSVELVEAPQDATDRGQTPVSTAHSSNSAPAWSDASLRAYLEDDSDIRDLLVVVHDKTNVKPAPPDHPLVKNLFKEENRRLGEISNQLDGLLGDWLARKSRTRRNQ